MSHFSTNPHSHLGAANYSYIQQGFGTDDRSNDWSQSNFQNDVFTATSSHEPTANAQMQHTHQANTQEPYHNNESSPSSLFSITTNSAVGPRSVHKDAGNLVHATFTADSSHSHATQKLHEPKGSEMSRKWSSKVTASINWWWQRHRYVNTWWWEITCCIIALGALLAIVATIRIHERKVLPQWRFGLTVNAVISAYTVILKAAAGLVLAEGISHLKWIVVAQPQSLSTFVAHDDASRGPLGALKLLFRNQYRSRRFHASPYISSLGALVTILVLLLDPFSQQIIRTYECERQTIGEIPTISRTNVYKEVGAHSGAGEATIRIPLRNAVYNGIFASQKPPTSFSCRTGKCTFSDTYTSLAYCSSCIDVSKELKITEYKQFDKLFNRTVPYTNVSLPVGRKWLTLSRGGEAMTRGYIGLKSYYDSELNMIRWDGRSSIPDNNQTIRAYRCNIYPCMQTFKANVSTGLVEEEIVEESEAVFSSLTQPLNYTTVRSVADLDCLDTPGQRQLLKQLGYQFNDTTRWLPYNVSLGNGTTEKPLYAASYYFGRPCERAPANQFPDLCNGNHTTEKANSIVPARCIYNIGHVTASSIDENLFKPMFSGEVRNSWTYGYPGYDGSEALTAVYNAGSGNGTLKELQDIMRGMTDTLTTYIRQSGDKGFSEPATGMMYDNTSCIQVRWAWLSYSAIVVGLLLAFFIWMTWYARSSQLQLQREWASADSKPSTHDFKSSASSLLFHGLDHETLRHMDDVGASNKEAEVEKRAEKVMVTLVASEQGWKLSGVGP